MSTLKVPSAQLAYEVVGSGPLLILIPGAAGVAAVFRPLISSLSAQYRVVTYDRRGFSRSRLDGPQDDDRRLATDADDVQRLIAHLTDRPAIVFGNSSGALVALEALIKDPERVGSVVSHEPPAVALLPDAAEWLAFFDGVYATYRTEGIPHAMRQFADGVLGSADRRVLEQARREHPDPDESNTRYWLEHELRQYPRAALDLDVLAARARQLVLVGGRDAHDQMTYRPNKILAQKLGLALRDLPGGHLGFLAAPAEFAAALLALLGARGDSSL